MTAEKHPDDVTAMLDFLKAGERLGIDIPAHLKSKLDRITGENSGKLRVALVGGFSEGKTSLIAAWLGCLPGTMKISQSESSDSVIVYQANDEIELIDTPGLFGYKERTDQEGGFEHYQDMTRKYVSEADLVLFVLNSSNPIRESHRSELNWLLRDLALLSRTIFVINRFDDVADLTDDEQYARLLAIKQANVAARLSELIGLTDDEQGRLTIVGVAANPYDMGIKEWLTRPDEHVRVSRIDTLRAAVADRVVAIGGAEEAKRRTCITVLRHVAETSVEPARAVMEHRARETKEADLEAKQGASRLGRLRREAANAQIALRTRISDVLADLILEIRSTSMDEFDTFYTRRIGRDGCVVQSLIANIFNDIVGSVSDQLITMNAAYVARDANYGAAISMLGAIGGRLKDNITIDNEAIKKLRDWVRPSYKFKPHDAVKAAGHANRALNGIGIAAELYGQIQERRKAAAFIERRQAIVDELEEQRSNLLSSINSPDFMASYFPQIAAMETMFNAWQDAYIYACNRQRAVEEWIIQAESLRLQYDPA